MDVLPLFASGEIATTDEFVLVAWEGGQISLAKDATGGALKITSGTTSVRQTIEWARNTKLTVTVNTGAASISVRGASKGDGSFSYGTMAVGGTGRVGVGAMLDGTKAAFSRISELRKVASATVACASDPDCVVCGDGFVNGAEVCDPSLTPYCTADCSAPDEPTECFEPYALCPAGASCPTTPNGSAFGGFMTQRFCVPTVPCLTDPASACGDTQAARCGRCAPPKPNCANKHCGDDMDDGAGGLCTGICAAKEPGCLDISDCPSGYACGKSAAVLFDPAAPAGANACWPISCEDSDPRRRDCGTISSPCGLCDPTVATKCFAGALCNKGKLQCSAGTTENEVGVCIPSMAVGSIADFASGPANIGVLPGTFDVTAAGAATYRVPVVLPPGRGDLNPSLSIAYNSSQGNGLTGLGWGVDGLSAISVCNKSLASDPKQDSAEPALCLDGQRLIPLRYDTANDQTEWRTETENFARVYSPGDFFVPTVGAADITPAYFIVKHKNGVEMTYGLEAESKLGGSTSYEGRTLTVRMWSISRATDRAGNRIAYLYSKATRKECHRLPGKLLRKLGVCTERDVEIVPRWIGYNFARNVAATYPASERGAGAEIKFEYLGEGEKITAACRSNPAGSGCKGYRPDTALGFWAGSAMTHEYRLGGISVYAVGSKVRRYSLSYRNAKNGLSELSAITECAVDRAGVEVCRPNTEFAYEPSLDGQGAAPQKWGEFSVGRDYEELSPPTYTLDGSPNGWIWGSEPLPSGTVNWNGDGYDDTFYLIARTVDNTWVLDLRIRDSRRPLSAPALDTVRVASLSPKGGWPYQESFDGLLTFSKNWERNAPHVFDLDGDGYDDILIADHQSASVRRFTRGVEVAPVLSSPDPLDDGQWGLNNLQFLDMDGDGDKDALSCNAKTQTVSYLTNVRGVFHKSAKYNDFDYLECQDFAIVNASDGREEFVWLTDYLGSLKKAWLDGRGFRVDALNVNYNTTWNYLSALDVNGDGLKDLLSLPLEEDGSGAICPDEDGDGKCESYHPAAYLNGGSGFDWYRGGQLESFGGPLADIDHDGRVDWRSGYVWVDYAGKEAAIPDPVPELHRFHGDPTVEPYADVNGDGTPDYKVCWRWMKSSIGTDTSCDIYLAPAPHANLLKTISRRETPNGVPDEIAITYAGGVAAGTYTPGVSGTDCDKPARPGSARCVKSLGTPVVKSVVRSSFKQKTGEREVLQTSRQDYTYKDGRVDPQGRGWIGFRTRTIESTGVDGVEFSVREEKYNLSPYVRSSDNWFYYPFATTPEQVTIATPMSANKFQRAAGYYRIVQVTQGREVRLSWRGAPFVVEPSVDTRLWDLGEKVDDVHEERTFDAYGNLKTTSTTRPLEPGQVDGTLLTYAYEGDPGLEDKYKWQVDLVGQSLSFSARENAEPNSGQQLSIVRYKYYGSGLLREIHSGLNPVYSGDGLSHGDTREDRSLITEFFLDSWNNVGMVTQRPASPSLLFPPRTWSFAYEEKYGVNVVETQNPEGHVERTRFGMADGLLRSYTDPNGVVTTWKYDGFGRRTEENRETEGIVSTLFYYPADAFFASAVAAKNASIWVGVSTKGALGSTVTSDVAYDTRGRIVAETRAGFRAQTRVGQEYEYDGFGRLAKASRPHLAGDSTQGANTFAYDTIGRLVQTTTADARQTKVYYATSGTIFPQLAAAYNGGRMDARYYRFVETPRQARLDVQVGDARGNTIRSEEGTSGLLDFRYGANEFLVSTTDAAGNVITRIPDQFGALKTVKDPSTGTHTFVHNAWGEVLIDQHNSETHQYTYDRLGRILTRRNSDGLSTWVWDTVGPGSSTQARTRYGELMRVMSPGEHMDEYSYEGPGGRINAIHRRVGTGGTPQEMASSYRYDDLGRINRVGYPGTLGLGVGYRYGVTGMLEEVVEEGGVNKPPTRTFWKLQDAYQGYRPRQVLLGDGTKDELTFDPLSGRLTEAKTFGGAATSPLQATTLHQDANGNVDLITRTGDAGAVVTGYEYDEQDRLTKVRQGAAANAPVLSEYTYKPGLGQLATKTGMGTYSYGEPSQTNEFGPKTLPYAARQIAIAGSVHNYHYDEFGRMDERSGPTVPGGTQKLKYNALGQLRAIEQGAVTTADFKYSAVGDRVFMKETDGTTHAYFGPMYEVSVAPNGATTATYRVMVGGQAVAEINASSNSQPSTVYLHRDHLGSVDLVTTKPSGGTVQVVERRAYGAFGEPVSSASAPPSTSVGYTGHRIESAAGGLTDMLGRFYDPNMARFVSPDPFITHPLAAKGYDRYAYVTNNPLSRIDPSGFGDLAWDGTDVQPPPPPPPPPDWDPTRCQTIEFSSGCAGPPVGGDDDGTDDGGTDGEPPPVTGVAGGRTIERQGPARPESRPPGSNATGGPASGPSARRGAPVGPGATTPLKGSDLLGGSGGGRGAEPSALDSITRIAERGLYGAADFSAGFGDSMTFGATGLVRSSFGFGGTVDEHSGLYVAGEAVEVAGEIALTAGSAAMRHAAAGASRRAVRNEFKRRTRTIAREGGQLHHNNPLFGHPGGAGTMFPTGGLPGWVAHSRANLRLLSQSAHTAAHAQLKSLERAVGAVFHPAATGGRAVANVLRWFSDGDEGD